MADLREGNGSGQAYPLQDMPRAAIQAIYHHATGKTENMSQSFTGNVLVSSDDIDNLHQMILDQLGVHAVEYGPTVTVVIKQANERAITHSSWAHYKHVSTISNDVTSEITIRYEFVLSVQNTPGPQRCIITVNVDSALPVLKSRDKDFEESWPFWLFISREWETAKVSIDFVDFMVARGFVNIVEEWFNGLKKSVAPLKNRRLIQQFNVFDNISIQVGRFGFAAFLAMYIFINSTFS